MQPEVFRLLALRQGLRLYHEHGLKANRAYTPRAMMLTAQALTGKTFRPRDYPAAIAALTQLLALRQSSSFLALPSESSNAQN